MINIEKNITLCIKTFERFEIVVRLVDSIKKFYNDDYLILIADDSKVNHEDFFKKYNNLKYYHLPYDVGISAGRNFLVKKVKTDYFITLDDDFIFDENTNIEQMKKLLIEYNLDILGGRYKNTYKLDSIGRTFLFKHYMLYLYPLKNIENEVVICDFIPQFFIAKVNKIKENNLWDEELKSAGEHVDFFIRAKQNNLKVGYSHDIYVIHDHVSNKIYYNMRFGRANVYNKIVNNKYNIIKVVYI